MAIKIEVQEKRPAERTYPWLGLSEETGAVVLFNRYRDGTALFTGSENIEVGHWSSHWILEKFTPFTGKITLSNGDGA